MIKYIVLVVIWFIEDFLAYKLIKKIDKNERIKVNKMEEKHIKYMLDNQVDDI